MLLKSKFILIGSIRSFIGAIKIIDGKAKLVDDRFCDGLGACLGHCPQDAITIVERDAPEFDEHEVKKHLAVDFRSEKKTTAGVSQRQSSELRQWPVQLTLVSPQASYFKDSDLLVAESYVDKLTEILKNNKIKTITLVNMEVPCCFGMQHIVEEAVKRAGKVIPIRQTVISIRGEKK